MFSCGSRLIKAVLNHVVGKDSTISETPYNPSVEPGLMHGKSGEQPGWIPLATTEVGTRGAGSRNANSGVHSHHCSCM